jgi:hypothetical protein
LVAAREAAGGELLERARQRPLVDLFAGKIEGGPFGTRHVLVNLIGSALAAAASLTESPSLSALATRRPGAALLAVVLAATVPMHTSARTSVRERSTSSSWGPRRGRDH